MAKIEILQGWHPGFNLRAINIKNCNSQTDIPHVHGTVSM
jgi:hypothetical protein